MAKLVSSASAAVADICDGASLAVGGFGLCGVPFALIDAVYERGVRALAVVSNNCGAKGLGLAALLDAGRIARATSSYLGTNAEFARQYLCGEIELELVPQGTLAERLRAGGVGIPACYLPTGTGTVIADGGMPWRYARDGFVEIASPAKEVREFGGRPYLLEEAIVTDFALVRARKGDKFGNLVFEKSARNFNPLCAMAGRITIAEVEEITDLDPDEIHLPGIFVDRVVLLNSRQAGDKPIELRTTQ